MGNENDTPIDNEAAVLNEKCSRFNFCNLPRNCEIRENFHPRKILVIQYIWRGDSKNVRTLTIIFYISSAPLAACVNY